MHVGRDQLKGVAKLKQAILLFLRAALKAGQLSHRPSRPLIGTCSLPDPVPDGAVSGCQRHVVLQLHRRRCVPPW